MALLDERLGLSAVPQSNRPQTDLGAQNRRDGGRRLLVALSLCGLWLLLFTPAMTFADDKAGKKVTRTLAQRDRIMASLRTQTQVDVVDQPLINVMEFIEALHNIPVVLDVAAMNDEGISEDTPITLTLEGVTLQFTLQVMLEPLQLEAIVEDDVLKITTAVAAAEKLETRVYDLKYYLGDAVDAELHAWLRETVKDCVAPKSWSEFTSDKGGEIAKVDQFKNEQNNPPANMLTQVFIVRQTAKTHREIEVLLTKLQRVWRPDQNIPLSLSERNLEKIRASLSTEVEVDFPDLPLTDVADDMKDLLKIPILIDEVELNDEGISVDTPIYANLKEATAENAWRIMLRPLALEAVPHGEALLITTSRRAEMLRTVRLYDVSDLSLYGAAGTIKAVVQPDDWDSNSSSPGAISSLSHEGQDGLLVIRQSERGHQEVETLLGQLRLLKQNPAP